MSGREEHLQRHIAKLVRAGTKRNTQLAEAKCRADQAELDLRNLKAAHEVLKRENARLEAEIRSRGIVR